MRRPCRLSSRAQRSTSQTPNRTTPPSCLSASRLSQEARARQRIGSLMHFVMLRRMALLVFTAGTLCSQPLSGADGPNRLTDTKGPARPPIDEAYGTLPLIFETNRGQAAEPVRFLARGVGYRLLLSPTDAVLHMASAPQDPGASLRMRFSGAAPRAAFIGLDEQPGKVNYF